MSDFERNLKIVTGAMNAALRATHVTEERPGVEVAPSLESRITALEAEVKSLREDMYKCQWKADGGSE